MNIPMLRRRDSDSLSALGGLESLGKRRKEFAPSDGAKARRAERADASESLGRGEVVLLSLFFVSFACFAVTASAATFTTNALIIEADTSFDGQSIVVSGATLTLDGRHYRPCSSPTAPCSPLRLALSCFRPLMA